MRFGWQHQERSERSCGRCGKERPAVANSVGALCGLWEDSPPGWRYSLVMSGFNPIYNWHCPECREFDRRLAAAEDDGPCAPGTHKWKTHVIPSTPDRPPGERVCYCDVCGAERLNEDD